MKGLVLDQWLGVFAPARTSADVASRLNSEINKAIADPAGARASSPQHRSRSAEPPNSSPPSFVRITPNSDGW